MVTREPAVAKRRAIASPIPLDAPVTSTEAGARPVVLAISPPARGSEYAIHLFGRSLVFRMRSPQPHQGHAADRIDEVRSDVGTRDRKSEVAGTRVCVRVD